jgi:hypothetical protein
VVDLHGMMGARGLFGIHISFKHPFGRHSLLGGAARTVLKAAPLVPLPGLSTAIALAGKAKALGKQIGGLGTALRTNSAMPGGAGVTTGSVPTQRAHRAKRGAVRGRSRRRSKGRQRARRR